ncbi:MAG: sensor histidine kinase, partial [Pseudomonadota bacterium]
KIDGERYIALNIMDNGEGISEKHINKIFDRFFRSEFHRSREHGGYGLGLSIVKSIVEAHGGKITVLSSPGKGSVFMIHLPVQEKLQ